MTIYVYKLTYFALKEKFNIKSSLKIGFKTLWKKCHIKKDGMKNGLFCPDYALICSITFLLVFLLLCPYIIAIEFDFACFLI